MIYFKNEYYKTGAEVKEAIDKVLCDDNDIESKEELKKIKSFGEIGARLLEKRELDFAEKTMLEMAKIEAKNEVVKEANVFIKDFAKIANSNEPMDFINFLNGFICNTSNKEQIIQVAKILESIEEDSSLEEFFEDNDTEELIPVYAMSYALTEAEIFSKDMEKKIKIKHESLDYSLLDAKKSGPMVG